MPDNQESFWAGYYRQVFSKGTTWLDYSNERVQAQSLALALESAGPVANRRCLDVGCGWGQFARCLAAMGASEVTGVDVVKDAIERHRRTYPQIRWICASLQDREALSGLGSFELVFAIEVLQYAETRPALETLWALVAAGGRLVGVVPNRDCPIVGKARERFGGSFMAPEGKTLAGILGALPAVASWGMRAMHFQEDQSLTPYAASPWTCCPRWRQQPNRFQWVAVKAPAPGEPR